MKRLFHRRNLLIAGAALMAFALTGCRPYKEDALSLLSGALTSYTWAKSDVKHIKSAEACLNLELNNAFWIDDTHLTLPGAVVVFSADEVAVYELQQVNAGDITAINDAIGDITQGDLGVSGQLIEDAQADANADQTALTNAENAWETAFSAYGSSDNYDIIAYSAEAWGYAWSALHPSHH